MKKVLFFVVVCLFALIWVSTQAEIPKLINYQGMLTESDGTSPVEDGTYNLGFKIYGSELGTDSLWWEYHSAVPVTNGLFNVILGSQSALNLPFDADYWLEIIVETEIMPTRLQFTSVGYAYRARMADTAAVAVSAPTGGGWVDDGSVVRLQTSTDKVGIGTTSPGAKLQVGDGSSDDFIRVMGSTAAASAEIGAHFDGFGYLKINDDGGTTTALIDPDGGVSYIKYGNLGIGTVSPHDRVEVVDGSMNARLGYHHHFSFPLPYDIYSGVRGTYGGDVEGFLGRRYYSTLAGNSYYGVYGSATTSGKNYGVYGSASGGSTNWAGFFSGDVHVSGNVGIGTTSPDDDLHVANHIRVGEDPTYPTVYGELKHDGGGTGFKINAHAGGGGWADLHFQTNATTKMFIESAGKVGIGTTSPSEKLDVEGNIDVSNNQIKNYYGFPKPNYDSGWQPISAGASLTFTHNIGGNVDNYVVDLWFHNNIDERHNFAIGGMETDAHGWGAFWSNLTNSQIKVWRRSGDTAVGQVRLRIWVYN